MGTFCETGRDAADAECKARCGAMVFWDCRHFCLLCSLRIPLTPLSPSPSSRVPLTPPSLSPSSRVHLTPPSPSPSSRHSPSLSPSPSPSPSLSRSRHRSRSPGPSSRRRDLQIIDDSQNSPRQRFRSPSLSSRERQPSPRADAASIHRARTWLSSFLGKKPAFIRVRKRARGERTKLDDALGSRKRGHEMVWTCQSCVMQSRAGRCSTWI